MQRVNKNNLELENLGSRSSVEDSVCIFARYGIRFGLQIISTRESLLPMLL